MSLAIVVEYQIQNECNVNNVSSRSLNPSAAPSYPNMYILPKKYASARDVKIADVIRSFPPQALGSQQNKANPLIGKSNAVSAVKNMEKKLDAYSNLHFRFETCI